MMRNIWLDGMMGLVTGDALGNPVQFMSRNEVKRRGLVTTMEAGGAYNTPAGTWTDDSSMALATLDSIREVGEIVPEDIMINCVSWHRQGDFTPFGRAFDEGITCLNAIMDFDRYHDWRRCGRTGEYANGNGALMRILPVCLFFIEKNADVSEAIRGIHVVTSLTHNHLRAKIASGIYYFMAKRLCAGKGMLADLLQQGMDDALRFYGNDESNRAELAHYSRLLHLEQFALTNEDEIKSSGYVVDTLEAAIWSLLNTTSYRDCLIKAVNLGHDADTVGAVAGGLAGLFYGYEKIPEDWLAAIQRRDWIERMCTWDFSADIPLTDIHIHVLPGLDDGSGSMEESRKLLQSEYRQGTRGMICTPHNGFIGNSGKLQEAWDEVRTYCSEELPDLALGLGSEVYCEPELMDEILEGLKAGSILPLNNTRYVLAEFSPMGEPFSDMEECVDKLLAADWIPVIAHAERYGKTYAGIEDVRRLKERGCLIQINVFSVWRQPNEETKSLANHMLKERLVDFLGTDTHRLMHRPPRIAQKMQYLAETYDEDYIRRIAYGNAKELLGV